MAVVKYAEIERLLYVYAQRPSPGLGYAPGTLAGQGYYDRTTGSKLPRGIHGRMRADFERARLRDDMAQALARLLDHDTKMAGAIYVRYLSPTKVSSRQGAEALGCSLRWYHELITRGLHFLDREVLGGESGTVSGRATSRVSEPERSRRRSAITA